MFGGLFNKIRAQTMSFRFNHLPVNSSRRVGPCSVDVSEENMKAADFVFPHLEVWGKVPSARRRALVHTLDFPEKWQPNGKLE